MCAHKKNSNLGVVSTSITIDTKVDEFVDGEREENFEGEYWNQYGENWKVDMWEWMVRCKMKKVIHIVEDEANNFEIIVPTNFVPFKPLNLYKTKI